MLPLGADDPRVIGEFRLHRRLGAGGMGRVYLASSPGGRAVAVKVVHSHLARDAAFRDRFAHEVAAAQAVNGAYAAPVIAAGPDDDPPWLATAYVAGPSLQEAVQETGPLPEDATVKLAAGLAEALHVIHDGGVVHRDLKPANVLLADDGPRVIDFGIARALDGTSATLPGAVIGTPLFMSPEQAKGQPTGPASDVFSLGGVLYFAATGTGPFGSGPAAIMLYRIVHTEPDLERLPSELRALVAACLAKDPARRPAPAGLAASLIGAPPPGDTPPVFWPARVARLIADYQARDAAGLMADGASSDVTRVPTGPGPAGPVPGGPAFVTRVPTGPVPGGPVPGGPVPASPVSAGAMPAGPVAGSLVAGGTASATPMLPASGDGPTPPAGAVPGQTQPVAGMGRRRALAVLAGMATAGLVVGGWELTRPGPSVAAPLPVSAADLAARRRISAAAPGTKIWTFEANAAVTSVLPAGNVVYAGTKDQAVYALDALTGRPRWRHVMDHGTIYFLAAAGGSVIASAGYNGNAPKGYTSGGVFALDAASGKLLWSVQTPYCDGLAVAGDVVYAATSIRDLESGGITALSTGTGQALWTFDFLPAYHYPQPNDYPSGPAVADGVVYTSTAHGALFALSGSTGEQIWRYADPAVNFAIATPEVSGGVVFATSRQGTSGTGGTMLYGIEAGTGRQLWQHPLGTEAEAFFDIDKAGLIFAVTNSGLKSSSSPGAGLLSAVNAVSGQQLWQVPVASEIIDVTASPGKNVVYTGSASGVLDAWEADTGNHQWSSRAGGAVNTQVLLDGGVAYFGCTDRRVYAMATGS